MTYAAYREFLDRADGVLCVAAATFGIAAPRLRADRTDPGQLAHPLREAELAVAATARSRQDLRAAAAVVAVELAAVRLDLTVWEARRGQQATQLMARALRRCRTATSVDEMAEMIPGTTADLGYDRVLFSSVDRGRWIPRTACTRTDPQEAAMIVAAGHAPACRRVDGLLEEEVVRTKSTILVRDVQGNPRVHAALVAVTGSHSYAAAPVLFCRRVVGLLHVDRNVEYGTMGEFDRDLIALLAEGLGLALERLAVLADMAAVHAVVADQSAALVDVLGRLGHEPVPGPGPAGPASVAVGRAPAVVEPGSRRGEPRPADSGYRWPGISQPVSGPQLAAASPGGTMMNRHLPPHGQPPPGRPLDVTLVDVHRLPGAPDAWRDVLTRREEQVLRLIATGLTNAQIGTHLCVAESTVKSHAKSLMRKLGVATRSEAGSVYHQHIVRGAPSIAGRSRG